MELIQCVRIVVTGTWPKGRQIYGSCAMAFRRRETGAPCEDQPHLRATERNLVDLSVVKILAVFALIIVVGLLYYVKDKEMVSGDGTIVQTTGSSPVAPRGLDERINPDVQAPAPVLVQPIPAPVLSPKE